MADFDRVLDDLQALYGSGTSVSAGSNDGGGTLWSTYRSGVTEDHDDIEAKEDVNNDHFDHNPAHDWVDNREREAATAYSSFLQTWNASAGFARDAELIYQMELNVDMWKDSVYTPIRNDGFNTRKSKLLESWYGPGAQSYAQVLQKQTAAMDEFVALVQTAEANLRTVCDTVKGIALATLNSGEAIAEAINDYVISGDIANHWVFGVRTDIGAGSFENLVDWINDLESSGAWIETMDDLKLSMQDAIVRSTSFSEDKWPAATADNFGDMQNGDGGLGNQNQPQQPQQPPTQPTQPTNPDGTPVNPNEVDAEGGEEFPD